MFNKLFLTLSFICFICIVSTTGCIKSADAKLKAAQEKRAFLDGFANRQLFLTDINYGEILLIFVDRSKLRLTTSSGNVYLKTDELPEKISEEDYIDSFCGKKILRIDIDQSVANITFIDGSALRFEGSSDNKIKFHGNTTELKEASVPPGKQ